MQYIILDMEWNQAWPGSSAARQPLPSPIRGEIVQIGAVRVTQDRQLADEFQILIRPKYFKKMNSKISKLTGIKDARLRTEGVSFPEAMERFRAWCGEDCVFLTWGFDDIVLLKENLALHALDSSWVSRWYNAQLIFNVQTDGMMPQRALKTAMEMMNIEPSRPAHDALGDAYHTALICARLDLAGGIEDYERAKREHENNPGNDRTPGCVDHRVYRGYADKRAALGAMAGEENRCPVCGEPMRGEGRWVRQPGKRFMMKCACPEHGTYLVRVRLSAEDDGTLRANRLTYEPDCDAAKSYETAAAKPRRRSGNRRRRRCRSAARQAAPKTAE